jgi:precorrin-2/cobalt-factor-2 C20-methyltransferase
VAVDRVNVDIAGSSPERDASLHAAAAQVADWLDEGATVAFATLGDPNLYSTFPALARLVAAARPGVPISSVPGVMAFQELAALTGTVVADDPAHTVVLAARDDVGALDAGLADPSCAVVLCKGGAGLPALARRLEERGRLDGAVVGELLGLPGGRSVPVADVADRPASYLASVIVPARAPTPTASVADAVASADDAAAAPVSDPTHVRVKSSTGGRR